MKTAGIVVLVGLAAYLTAIYIHFRGKLRKEKLDVENDIFAQKLELTGFSVEKKLCINNCYLYLEDSGKRWIYREDKKEEFRCYNYEDILDYELYENGNSILKTGAITGTIGAATFGTAGAVVGTNIGKMHTICDSLQLIIRVNDFRNPQIVINFIDSPLQMNSGIYKIYMEKANEFVSFIIYMMNNKEKC